MNFTLPRARQVALLLFSLILLLATLSTAGQLSKYLLGHPRLQGFVPAFYVDYESTVPTWFSSGLLALAAVLLTGIALTKYRLGDRFTRQWTILAIGFFFLSADEIAMFHEYPIDPLREAWGTRGLFYYAWVIPGFAIVAALGLYFLRFLWNLPSRSRWLFISAASIYLGGALGVEMLSGLQADQFGEENLTYALIVTLEELMEMSGIALFIYALLSYVERTYGRIRLTLGSETVAA